MSYLVTVYNKYADGTEVKCQTNTDAIDLKEAYEDGLIEAMTQRMHNSLDYQSPPTHQKVSLFPTLSLRKT